MTGTISDWIIALEKAGFKEEAAALHSDKLQDYKRLKESGLPTFEDLILPFHEFKEGNASLEGFLRKHDNFVVRAIPNTRNLPRRYKIGVKTFVEFQEFLLENINSGDEEKYQIFITEFEPQNMAGAVISRGEDVLIEIARGNLDAFSHGQTNPIACGHFAFHGYNHYKSMQYTTNTPHLNKLLWNVLQCLRTDTRIEDFIPEIDFMRGYFEFVITEKGSIKFLDYKLNDAYLV